MCRRENIRGNGTAASSAGNSQLRALRPREEMIRSDVYGISRTRDKKGKIIKQSPLPWVNCIHTMVGGGYETMQVLVLEVYDEDDNTIR